MKQQIKSLIGDLNPLAVDHGGLLAVDSESISYFFPTPYGAEKAHSSAFL